MASWRVRVRGLVPGAAGMALPEADREFVIHDMDRADAERAARGAAVQAGIEHAYVVASQPWLGPREIPYARIG